MMIEPAPEIIAVIQEMSARWRDGDAYGVLATMTSADPSLMADPGGAVVGRDAVAAFIRQVIPFAAGPGGGKVHFHNVVAFRDGDFGWAYAEGKLTIPGAPECGWNAHAALRREDGAWRWVMMNAGPPGVTPPPPTASTGSS